jgi:UDP-glucuronate 4-epimerase
MTRYLLTGCAGFIASHVAQQLLAQGHQVVGIDNLNAAYDIRLKRWRLERLLQQPNFHYHQADISDFAQLNDIYKTYDGTFAAVINLAARAGVRQSLANPWVYIETNTTGTLNLLELCREHTVGKFILASTSSLYGTHNTMPYSEATNTDRPISPYAASKKGAEALAYTYYSLYGIDTTVLRYFTVYGPAGRPDMSIFRFIQWINEGRPVTVFGDGQQSRDFTYVQDIARGTIAALRPVGYEIINLGSDEPVILMTVIRKIEEQLGKSANLVFKPRHPADVTATWADISKAEALLQWRPQTHYEQGLSEAVQWYLENRAWAKDIATGV